MLSTIDMLSCLPQSFFMGVLQLRVEHQLSGSEAMVEDDSKPLPTEPDKLRLKLEEINAQIFEYVFAPATHSSHRQLVGP